MHCLGTDRITIYDPCCGGAYQLTTLALRHGQRIKQISAADLDPDALALADKNLGLLQPAGSLHTFLNHLLPLTSPNTILALAMSKKQKATHEAFRPLGRFQVGKRRIQFLGLISHGDNHLDLNTDLAR